MRAHDRVRVRVRRLVKVTGNMGGDGARRAWRQRGVPELSARAKDGWLSLGRDRGRRAPRRSRHFCCHSLGCWAVDHLLAEHGTAGVHAALLVAPPSPFLIFEPVDSFLPPPRRAEVWAPLAARTLLVGSDNDDYASAEELEDVARRLGIACRILPGAGHINIAAGYGPWPFVLEWLQSVEQG
jgi:predicted alpha/beta hydrolase family esterase